MEEYNKRVASKDDVVDDDDDDYNDEEDNRCEQRIRQKRGAQNSDYRQINSLFLALYLHFTFIPNLVWLLFSLYSAPAKLN